MIERESGGAGEREKEPYQISNLKSQISRIFLPLPRSPALPLLLPRSSALFPGLKALVWAASRSA
jgi:hypothetical protein